MWQAQKLLYSKSVTGHLITVVYTIKGIFRKEEMHIDINIANENQQTFPLICYLMTVPKTLLTHPSLVKNPIFVVSQGHPNSSLYVKCRHSSVAFSFQIKDCCRPPSYLLLYLW